MKHGSLFSGFGGFDLAAEWMGWDNVFQVEIDPYCQKVLQKNFPDARRYKDIRDFSGRPGRVDILTGGFPCQPYSYAGSRKGTNDDRDLWPEYYRIIREIQPTYVLGENVAGLLTMEGGVVFDRICTDLEREGYKVETFNIPACSTEAWHRRERIFIFAFNENAPYPPSTERQRSRDPRTGRVRFADVHGDASHSNTGRNTRKRQKVQSGRPSAVSGSKDVPNSLQPGWKKQFRWKADGVGGQYKLDEEPSGTTWKTEPLVGRMDDGLPHRVERIRGLGNAVVPQVAYEIFLAIETFNRNHMKKADLIKVAEELNTVIGFDDPIDTGLSIADLKQEVKKGALWLYATDEVTEESIEVLRQLEWTAADFEDLKKDQDPLPAFYRHAIMEEPKEEEKKEEPATAAAEEEPEVTEEPVDDEPTEYTEDPAKSKPKKAPKSQGPSPYAVAQAIMGTDPEMLLPDLYEAMEKKGFDLKEKAGTIKTARAAFRKAYKILEANGHIKK